jgi:hypothetical protein
LKISAQAIPIGQYNPVMGRRSGCILLLGRSQRRFRQDLLGSQERDFPFLSATPVRLLHRKGLDYCADCIRVAARFKPTFFPLEISDDLFAWDPM